MYVLPCISWKLSRSKVPWVHLTYSYMHTLIGCNMAARGLTDIYAQSRGHESEDISVKLLTAVLQHLCNIFNSRVLHCS